MPDQRPPFPIRVIRPLLAVAAILTLSGCLGARQGGALPPLSPASTVIAVDASAPSSSGVDCATVKLFEPVRPKIHRDAPAHLKPWLGHWGPGLWGGRLCHELVIEEIRADGTARVADLQGFYRPWNRWPTAFRREARFREDGALVVPQGRMGVSTYRLKDGVLEGAYSWGAAPLHVTLVRKR